MPKVIPATVVVKVRVLRSVVLVNGVAKPGEEHEVSAADARMLVSSGAAEVVEGRAFTTIEE